MRSMAYVLLMVFVGQGTLKGLGADTWVGETQFFLNGCKVRYLGTLATLEPFYNE